MKPASFIRNQHKPLREAEVVLIVHSQMTDHMDHQTIAGTLNIEIVNVVLLVILDI